jgi:hypothetical protein
VSRIGIFRLWVSRIGMGYGQAANSAARRAPQYTNIKTMTITRILLPVLTPIRIDRRLPRIASAVEAAKHSSIPAKISGPNRWYRNDAIQSPCEIAWSDRVIPHVRQLCPVIEWNRHVNGRSAGFTKNRAVIPMSSPPASRSLRIRCSIGSSTGPNNRINLPLRRYGCMSDGSASGTGGKSASGKIRYSGPNCSRNSTLNDRSEYDTGSSTTALM